MISKIELHLRSSAIGEHRNLGAIAVEHERSRLTPNEDIACWVTGRRVEACITSVHERGGALPRVYADEIDVDALAG
jgi:hypothetical protein